MKAVVERTGVKAVTLRAWERRYGIPEPSRTEGGQRTYSRQDIELIRWLVEQRKTGLSISKAVASWRARSAKLAEQATPVPVESADQFSDIRQKYVSACRAYDEKEAQAALDQAFSRWHPQTVALEILLKSTAELGELWHKGELTVQQEHFATTLTLRHIERLIAASPPPVRHERIIVGCAPNDYHSLSTLLVTYLLRQAGFDVVHLGANVPVEEIGKMLKVIRPKLLILSAQRLHSVAHFPALAHAATAHDVLLAYGGSVFNRLPALRTALPGHFLGNSLRELAPQVTHLLESNPSPNARVEPAPPYVEALAEFEAKRNYIEGDVWREMVAGGQSTRYLAAINREVAAVLTTLLQIGSVDILEPSVQTMSDLLISYRPSKEELRHYLKAYARTLHRHLEHAPLRDWFDHFLQ